MAWCRVLVPGRRGSNSSGAGAWGYVRMARLVNLALRILLALALIAATVCALTGIVYALTSGGRS